MVLGLETGSRLCHMSYWASRSSNMASSSNGNWMSKKNSEIPVINLDNLDEYCTRGFIDSTNIQEEEYMERADVILEKLQDESRNQERPKEKRRKLCNHLKSLFHQKLWLAPSHPKRPVTQVNCKAAPEERHHFASYIPTVWAFAPTCPTEHEIIIHGCPKSI